MQIYFKCVLSEVKRQVHLSPAECQVVRDPGTLRTQEFIMRDIEPNVLAHLTWYSHGRRDSDATCVTTDFTRNSVEYTKVTNAARLSLPLLPTPGRTSRDWLLEVRKSSLAMPASKLSHKDARFGIMIWRYEKPSCSSSSSLQAYQQIYKGDADIRI